MVQQSHMRQEALEAGHRIDEQLKANQLLVTELAEKIRAFDPLFIVLLGRGSSDHAGLFGKYLFEIETGIPVLHAAPSVVTVYAQPLRLDRALVIAISQSGKSPDIVNYLEMANKQGAMTIALVNEVDSPLANTAEAVVPLRVGHEQAVAATKSYLGSLSALLQLVAHIKNEQSLLDGVRHLPQAMAMVLDSQPQLLMRHLAKVSHCIVMGRGFGYAIGMEMALKLKEVCAIQAECFSSAEFLHGPVRIVSADLRILDIQIQDESYAMHIQQSQQLDSRGAVMTRFKCDETWIHPRVIPVAMMQRFYLDLEVIGREMGYNPDRPEGLSKVTETH